MINFMKEYGITLGLMSHYVLDSKLYPSIPTQCIQMIKYKIPHAEDYEVTTHATEEVAELEDIFQN